MSGRTHLHPDALTGLKSETRWKLRANEREKENSGVRDRTQPVLHSKRFLHGPLATITNGVEAGPARHAIALFIMGGCLDQTLG